MKALNIALANDSNVGFLLIVHNPKIIWLFANLSKAFRINCSQIPTNFYLIQRHSVIVTILNVCVIDVRIGIQPLVIVNYVKLTILVQTDVH